MNTMNEYFADCYVLTSQRKEEFILDFLNHFITNRKEQANEYEIPQWGNETTHRFQSVEHLIRYLVENNTQEYSIYWSNTKNEKLKGGQVFFTNDGYLIVGLYCLTEVDNSELEDTLLKELFQFCSTDVGYITYEDIPPMNSIEFKKKARLSKR